jgi:hypothetical protein
MAALNRKFGQCSSPIFASRGCSKEGKYAPFEKREGQGRLRPITSQPPADFIAPEQNM